MNGLLIVSTFPGMPFRDDASIPRGARPIAPRAAAVAETMGWCYVGQGEVLPGCFFLCRSRLGKATPGLVCVLLICTVQYSTYIRRLVLYALLLILRIIVVEPFYVASKPCSPYNGTTTAARVDSFDLLFDLLKMKVFLTDARLLHSHELVQAYRRKFRPPRMNAACNSYSNITG